MTHAGLDDLTATLLGRDDRRSHHERRLDEALRVIGDAKRQELRVALHRDQKLRVRRKAHVD